jgi:hypothetical protein
VQPMTLMSIGLYNEPPELFFLRYSTDDLWNVGI